jgi:hypothetical protein
MFVSQLLCFLPSPSRQRTTYRVEEDIMLRNFFIWPMSILGLCEIPLCQMLGRDASLEEQIAGALATPAKRSHDHRGGLATQHFLTSYQILVDLRYQLFLAEIVSSAICECLDARQWLSRVRQLPTPCLDAQRCACVAGMVSVRTQMDQQTSWRPIPRSSRLFLTQMR